MDLPRYKFNSLKGSNTIRVIELNCTKTRLEVRIIHISVYEHPFQALSYVWGDPCKAGEAIVLNELGTAVGWIPLTQNLVHALCDLRDTAEIEQKTFWIDQICINQQDEKEKNGQVAMMSEIYSQSTRVITYLGPTVREEHEIKGLSLLKRIHETISQDAWDEIHGAGSVERIDETWREEGLELEELPDDLALPDEMQENSEEEILKRYEEQAWDWIVNIAYGPWTQRLWIVQEQLLNAQVIALRGRHLIEWDHLVTIPMLFEIDYLPDSYRDIGLEDMGERQLPPNKIASALYSIWWERHNRLKEGESWSSLIHNLHWYEGLQYEDKRDRIYSILAVSSDTETLGITPDYSAENTTDVLSRAISIKILTHAEDLWILTLALQWRQPDSTLPSWCINIDWPDEAAADNFRANLFEPHPIQTISPIARFSRRKNTIIVKGRILDSMLTRPGSEPSVIHDDPELVFLSSLLELLLDEGRPDMLISILRTLGCDGNWSPPTDDRTTLQENVAFHLTAYLRDAFDDLEPEEGESSSPTEIAILELGARVITGLSRFLPSWATSDTSSEIEEEADTAYELVSNHSLQLGRILGLTAGGRCYNCGSGMQVGDVIAVFQGTDKLYVLRPGRDAYTLVADCFLDGMMNGEAYEGLDPNSIDIDIRIR